MAAGSIVIDLLMKTGSFVTDAKKAESAVKGIGSAVDTVATKLRSAMPAISAAFTAAAASSMAYADELVDVAKANDVAIESIVQLSDALAASGGNASNSGTFLAAFTNYLDQAAEGSEKAQTAFKSIGVSLKDLETLGTDELFRKTVEQIAKVEDPLKRNALAMDAFGKAAKGVDFIELNNQLQTTTGLTESQKAGVIALANVWDQLSQAGRDFKIVIAEAIGPGLQAIADYFSQIGGGSGILTAFKTIFQTIAVLAANVGFVITAMVNDIKGLIEAAKSLAGKGGMAGAMAILKQTAEEDRKNRAALDLAEQRIMGTAYKMSDKDMFVTPKQPSAFRRTIAAPKSSGADKAVSDAVKQSQREAEAAAWMEYNIEAAAWDAEEKLRDEQIKRIRDDADFEIDVGKHLLNTINDIAAEEHALMSAGRDLFEATRTPAEKLNREYERLNDLLNAGAIDWDTYSRAVFAAQDAFEVVPGAIEKIGEETESVKKIMETAGRTFTDFFANMLTGTKQSSMSFSAMARSIVADILKIQIQKRITDPIVKAGTAFLDSALSSFKFWETGGVPGGNSISAYRNQVVSNPTMFAFANGAGLMGEAGPEAIMPLTRTASGDLGVRVEGANSGSATNVHVTYNIQSWDSRDTLQAITQSAPQIVGIVQNAFNKRGRSGPLG